jgi:hypothetical protein
MPGINWLDRGTRSEKSTGECCTKGPRVGCRTAIEGVWKVDHAVLREVASGLRVLGGSTEVLLGVVLVRPRVAENKPCDSGPGRCSRRRVSELVVSFGCLLVVVIVTGLAAREQ